MRLILPAFLIIAASVFQAWGESANLVPGIQFTHLTFSQGLKSGEAKVILQDRQGYLWIGTAEGLSRYDGYEIRNYGISSVTALLEGQQGDIWVGTESGGLLHMDPQTGDYRPVVLQSVKTGSGEPNGKITALLHGNEPGRIFVGDSGGVSSLKEQTLTIRRIPTPGSQGANVLFRDSAGRLWAGTDSGDLMVHDPAADNFETVWEGGSTIRSICEDAAGNLWLATKGRGVIRLTDGNGAIQLAPFREGSEMQIRNATSVLQDSRNHIWIGSPEGLTRFDPEKQETIQFRHDPLEPGSLLSNRISFLFEDRRKVLWIGFATGGVSRFSVDKNWFPRIATGLSHRSVWSLAEGREGEIWIGTGDGINRWSPDSGVAGPESIKIGESGKLSLHHLTAIHEDRQGRLWLGTGGDGLVRSSREEDFETASFFRHDPNRDDSLPDDFVTDIVEDEDGKIWVATARGLALFDDETRTFARIPRADVEEPAAVSISDLHLDPSGVIWAGTHSGELLRYLPAEGHLVKQGQFEGSEITVIFGETKNRLWIGRRNKGLSRLDLATQEILTLSQRNSDLPDSDVRGIVGDKLGNLWISTRNGLARLDPQSFEIRVFDEHDGLQSSIWHPRVMLHSADGSLIFGGPNGLNVIDPKNLPQAQKPSRVILTGLELFGEPIFPSKDGILKKPLAVTDVLRIPFSNQNRISLRFGTLDYSTPRRSLFRYKLEGIDEDWQMADDSRRATYIGLPPGRYGFQVEASADGKNWNPESARLKVAIQPPWWALWYVRTLIAFIVVGLITVLVFLRFQDRERKIRRAQEQLEIKFSRAEAGMARQLQHAMLLEQTGLAIGTGVESGNLLDTALRHLGEACDVSRCYVQIPTPPDPENEMNSEPRRIIAEYLKDEQRSFDDVECDVLIDAIGKSDRAIAIDDVSGNSLLFPERDRLETLGIRSILAIRVAYLGNIKGYLVLQQCDTARVWHSDEIKLLESLAGQFGMVLTQVEQQEKDERHRRELEKAKQGADSANKSKSDFLAKMTHELRTPLNAIIGFSELLGKEEDLTSSQRETVDIINHSGEHLLEIINDILEISKIEAGKVDLVPEKFNLANLLKSVYEMLAFGVRSKGLNFEITKLGELPSVIEADKAKIRQVLINLISNSAKFTEAGSITLKVRAGAFSTPDGTKDLYFEVHDTGPGIASDEISLIFDNFSQTETGVQSRKGTGLGLAICKSFVELMGGKIEVESEVGAGAIFRFSLPCKEITGSQSADEGQPIPLPAPKRKRLAPGQPEIRILIAEDQPANRLLAKRILDAAGFTIEEAENGAEAVDKWRSVRPHLILMDEEMPVMRGAEAVRIIRSEGENRETPKIISLTAFALDEARAAALKSGCDDFLAKPFKSDDLMEMIARHLSIQFETGDGQSGSNAA